MFALRHITVVAIGFVLCAASISISDAQQTRKETASKGYALKDLDGHFPFAVPETKDEWEKRAAAVRSQIEVSLGLVPRPTMATLKPVSHSRREMDGYAVENVYFESLPGLFVCGNLYTPLGDSKSSADGRYPAVLCPHGHWANGRFYLTSDQQIKNDLADGAERFESSARSPLQARCVQMARMGIVVLFYDMLGYADSQQIDMERAHGFGQHGPNPEVASDHWLLFSPQAEGNLQNVMGLQTINTLQALEYLLQRSDVDPNRISITGASGGGTQTFIATAIEPRILGSYPVVMVSTSMQGGCTCENACGLRVGTGNVEFAALSAPRPLGVNAANDWTRDMAKDGFPELKKLYALLGAEDRVQLHSATHFGHNYNHVTRVRMYGFMNRLFGLGLEEPVLERDFHVLSPQELSVWNAEHPAPEAGVGFESGLLKRWSDDIAAQLRDRPELSRHGWETLLRPAHEIASTLTVEKADGLSRRSDRSTQLAIIRNAEGDEVGRMEMVGGARAKPSSIHVSTMGEDHSKNDRLVLQIDDAWAIDRGTSVQSLVNNPRPSASYTYGYNPPLFLRRLAVLIAVLDSPMQSSLQDVAWHAEGADVALVEASAALRPSKIKSVEGDAHGFEFENVESIKDANFLPGAIRYGGRTGLRALYREAKE